MTTANYAGDVFHHGQRLAVAGRRKTADRCRYQVNGKTYDLHDYLKRQNVSGHAGIKKRPRCL